ncbi:MAG: hypothetical protein QOD39_3989 [Mycobacterium sp.]|jgi:hypothetical protein|nr:hypothetical protein [Mycobacterium sp.]
MVAVGVVEQVPDLWTVPASVDAVSSCPIRREFVDGFDTP